MLKQKLSSRKLWMALATTVIVIANEGFNLGISADAYWAIILPIMGYIFGESYVDANR